MSMMDLIRTHLQLHTETFRHILPDSSACTIHLQHHPVKSELVSFSIKLDDPDLLLLMPRVGSAQQVLLQILEGELQPDRVGKASGKMHRFPQVSRPWLLHEGSVVVLDLKALSKR